MKCEMGSCSNKAKLKLSVDTGWRGSYCFKHSFQMVKKLLKQVHEWGRAVYIQKSE